MGTPLRKPRFVANDAQRPAALPMPVPVARVIPFVRLQPAPQPRHISGITCFAVFLMVATIFMFGVIAGTVFWFTYDDDAALQTPSLVSSVAPRLEIAPQEITVDTPATSQADIVLPIENSDMAPVEPDATPSEDTLSAPVPASTYISVRDAEPSNEKPEMNTNFLNVSQPKEAEAKDDFHYRLGIAIRYDRNGQGTQALMLYRQVMAISDESDNPLPADVIASIRMRADYLESMQVQE